MAIVYATEGPAGSGKSTRTTQWLETYPTALVMQLPTMPRLQDAWFGAWSSSKLEYEAIAAATMAQRDVIVDRFMLSRWVYRALQDNSGRLSSTWYNELARSFRNLKSTAVIEAWDRLGTKMLLQPDADVTVLLPPLHQLQYQRQMTKKAYPFDAQRELDLYTEMARKLMSDPILGLNVHIDRY